MKLIIISSGVQCYVIKYLDVRGRGWTKRRDKFEGQ
jgi:hypothetical protein